jgi:hypothetical protein
MPSDHIRTRSGFTCVQATRLIAVGAILDGQATSMPVSLPPLASRPIFVSPLDDRIPIAASRWIRPRAVDSGPTTSSPAAPTSTR